MQARSQKSATEGKGVTGMEPPVLKNFAFAWQKQLNFRPILKNNTAIETWHRNKQ